ncbi:MAG: hypothetical protein HYR84_10480 [Planctomycetes bacterium]|nr:hypothetical protein [Planctomycetota bacterium]
MNEITEVKGVVSTDEGGTKITRFLANKGVILIKETREIGSIKCEYGAKLKADTMILATAKSSTKVSQKSFGVRLESTDSKEREDSAHLDFDESEEFSNAITFIHEAAQRIANEKRDYTEATFRTKDHIEIGFYQDVDQVQKAFVRLGGRGEIVFIPITSLPIVKKLIEAARAHLIKKGAGAEEPQTF